jgi:hypothetical protein
MGLSKDVAEMWVGREFAGLVQDRIAHDRFHAFAHWLKAVLKVFPYFRVTDLLQAFRAKP